MTDRPEPLPHWCDQCRKESFAEHVAECTTPIMAGRPAMPTPVSDALAEEADADELLCPLCDQPISDGDRRVSWFAKTGGETTERGSVHLECLALATREPESR